MSLDPVTTIALIRFASSSLRSSANNVKVNHHQCKRLSHKIQNLFPLIEELGRTKNVIVNFTQSLESLQITISDCHSFVSKFESNSYIQLVAKGGTYYPKFQSFNQELSRCANELGLAASVRNQIFNKQIDEKECEKDLEYLKQKRFSILNELEEQERQQQKSRGLEFHPQRYNSFKYSFDKHLEDKNYSISLKKSDVKFPEIPFYDLEIDEKIGGGGFGDVYKGNWLTVDQRVGIKLLRCSSLSDDLKEEFFRECELMNHVRGFEHIVSFLGACTEPGNYSLVMEYLPEGSLYKVLRQKRVLTWEQKTKTAYQICKSINFLHLLPPPFGPVLHRDIKSLNFLLDSQLNIKVCDFGLSKVRRESSINSVHMNIGTLHWTAPELMSISRKVPYNEKCDVYSIGVVLWELATGQIPFDGINDSVIRSAVMAGERLPIPDDIPAYFTEWINLAWAQSPSDRPTCSELMQKMKARMELAISPPSTPILSTILPVYNSSSSSSTSPPNAPPAMPKRPSEEFVNKLASEKALYSRPIPPPPPYSSSKTSNNQSIPETSPTVTSPTPVMPPIPPRLSITDPKSALTYTDATTIISNMQEYSSHADVQRKACEGLNDLLENQKDESIIVNSDGIELIIRAMKDFPSDERLQEQGCWSICFLSSDSKNQERICKANGINVLLATMKFHSDNDGIQEHSCGALANIATTAIYKEDIVQQNGIELILTSMKTHLLNVKVCEQACAAIVNLSSQALHQLRLASADGINIIVSTMNTHPNSEGVQEQSARAIRNLASHPNNQEKVVKSNCITPLLTALKTHYQNAIIQIQVCGALRNIAQGSKNGKKAVVKAGGITAVTRSQNNNSHQEAILRATTQVLLILEGK